LAVGRPFWWDHYRQYPVIPMTQPIPNETALEEVMRLMENPPAEGSAEDVRLGVLLKQVIAASIPGDEDEDDAVAPLAVPDALKGRLDALAKKRSSDKPFGDNPDGLGPTLGMDVGRS
jgi:hypothetical protein